MLSGGTGSSTLLLTKTLNQNHPTMENVEVLAGSLVPLKVFIRGKLPSTTEGGSVVLRKVLKRDCRFKRVRGEKGELSCKSLNSRMPRAEAWISTSQKGEGDKRLKTQ